MNNIEKELLKEIIDLNEAPKGAYSIRKNGQGIEKKITENVNIVAKEDEKFRIIQDQNYVSTMDEFYKKYMEENKDDW